QQRGKICSSGSVAGLSPCPASALARSWWAFFASSIFWVASSYLPAAARLTAFQNAAPASGGSGVEALFSGRGGDPALPTRKAEARTSCSASAGVRREVFPSPGSSALIRSRAVSNADLLLGNFLIPSRQIARAFFQSPAS